MDEEPPISYWANALDRFWPMAPLTSITLCTISCLEWLGAAVMFSYYPSRKAQAEIYIWACCGALFFLLSTWIMYRRQVRSGDQTRLLAATFSAIFTFLGVAAELIVFVLAQHHPHR
jgi:hypothetical protein